MTFNKNKILNILGYSFYQAWKWSLWKWALTVGIGILTSLIPYIQEKFKIDGLSSLVLAGGFLIILYFVRFFLIFIKESFKYYHEIYKNSSYGDAIILLKESFAEAHYYRKTPGFQEEEFMKSMMVFCNNLKIIYDKITNSNCAVSIKIPINDDQVNGNTILKNLTRNKEVRKRDTDEYIKTPHTIIGNTAFTSCLSNVIANKKDKFYINNKVNNTDNYDNTSKKCYDNGILPYNSELVHPLVPLITIGKLNYDCHGFICVDSDKENAFDGKYHTAILEGVADGIYDMIMEKNKTRSNE